MTKCFHAGQVKLFKDVQLKTLAVVCNGVSSREVCRCVIDHLIVEFTAYPWYQYLLLDLKFQTPLKGYVVEELAKLINKLNSKGLKLVLYVEPLNSFTRFNVMELRERCGSVPFIKGSHHTVLEDEIKRRIYQSKSKQ